MAGCFIRYSEEGLGGAPTSLLAVPYVTVASANHRVAYNNIQDGRKK